MLADKEIFMDKYCVEINNLREIRDELLEAWIGVVRSTNRIATHHLNNALNMIEDILYKHDEEEEEERCNDECF